MVTSKFKLQELLNIDASFVYELFNHPLVLKSYRIPPVPEKEKAVDFICKIKSGGNLVWKVSLIETDEEIGIVALHHFNKLEKTIEIGGTLLPTYWGKGIMVETFNMLMDYAKNELAVKYVFGRMQKTNEKAKRLVAKLGFTIIEEKRGEILMGKQLL